MPKYEIGIKMEPPKGVTTRGRGLRPTGAAPTARDAMQQAQDLKRAFGKKDGQDPQSKMGRGLIGSLNKLDKSILKLDKDVNTLSLNVRQIRRAGGLGGAPGGPGRGPGGGGAPRGFGGKGGGLGRVGTAMGILGIPVAAFAYIVQKVMSAGRASIAKVMEQQGAAGVAGFQRTGRYTGVFSAAEFGQYLKERRMAAGTFEPSREEYKTGRGLAGAPLGVQTSAIFGTGAEFAKTAGLLDVSARMRNRTGEQDLNEIITRTFRRTDKGVKGIGTELPFLLRELTSNMEEAVREGVNASDMAKDMATQVVSLAGVVPGGQVRTAMQMQKSLMNVQKQAARGPGDVPQWRMHVAARTLLRGGGPQSQKLQQRLIESGLATSQTIEAAKAGTLGHNQMMMLTTALNQMSSGAVREEYVKDIVTKVGGPGTRQQRAARLAREGLRGNMLSSMGITPTQAISYVGYFDRRKAAVKYNSLLDRKSSVEKSLLEDTGRERSELNESELDILLNLEKKIAKAGRQRYTTVRGKETTVAEISKSHRRVSPEVAFKQFEKTMKIGAPVRVEKGLEGAKETMLLSKTADALRTAVHTVDTSMIKMAKRLAKDGKVTTGIIKLNGLLEILGKKGVQAATGISDIIKAYEKLVARVQKWEAEGGVKGFVIKKAEAIYSDTPVSRFVESFPKKWVGSAVPKR